jgi:hypothetical protein
LLVEAIEAVPTLRIENRSSCALMRWCALTIAVLAMLPFTPPFSTCDLGVLFADRTLQRETPAEGKSSGPSIADAVYFLESAADDKEHLKHLSPADSPLPVRASATADGPSPWLVPIVHDPFSLVSSPILRV